MFSLISKVDRSKTLCVGFSNPQYLILLPNFLYMLWIKRYLYVNTNVEIPCLNLSNLRIIKCNQSSGSKIEDFYGSEITVDKISGPPHKYERKHSLWCRQLVSKSAYLWCRLFLLLCQQQTSNINSWICLD